MRLINECPECGGKLTYERGFPGTYWEPPEPEQLFCEACDWEAEDEIEQYLIYEDDEERGLKA